MVVVPRPSGEGVQGSIKGGRSLEGISLELPKASSLSHSFMTKSFRKSWGVGGQ